MELNYFSTRLLLTVCCTVDFAFHRTVCNFRGRIVSKARWLFISGFDRALQSEPYKSNKPGITSGIFKVARRRSRRLTPVKPERMHDVSKEAPDFSAMEGSVG